MTLKLAVTTNVNGDVFELVLKNARYGVGRRHDNDLRIKESYISGYHAELTRRENGDYLLSDLGSSNGTFINGRRVEGKEVVKAGDFIKFGILKVAVQEHTETAPKIVALKDRPAFAKKDDSNTASIAVEKTTGKVATLEAISAKGETQPTITSPSPSKELGELKSKLDAALAETDRLKKDVAIQSDAKASLEKEIEGLRKELKTRETRLESLTGDLGEKNTLEAELKRIEAEKRNASLSLTEKTKEAKTLADELNKIRTSLAEAEISAAQARKELSASEEARKEVAERLQAEIRSLTETLQTKDANLKVTAKEAAEVAVLTASLAEVRSELQKARELAAAEGKSRTSLESEVKSLKETLSSKDADLKVTAKEAAGVAALTASMALLQSELNEARDVAASEGKSRAALEKEIKEKTGELSSMQAKLAETENRVQKLIDATEKDKTGLSGELTSARSLAESLSADLKKVQAELAAERRQREADLKGLEQERTKLAKSLQSAETSLEKQSGEVAQLKATLREKEDEVKITSAEAKKGGKAALELEALKAELAATRADLASVTVSEKESLKAVNEATLRSEALAARLKDAEATGERLKEELQEKSNLVASGQTEVERLKTDLEKVRRESAETMGTELPRLEGIILGLTAQLNESKRQVEEAQKLVGGIEIDRSSLRNELAQLRSNSGDAEAEASKLREKLSALESERGELQSQLKLQVGDLQAAKAEANELRLELRKTRESSDASMAELEKSLRSKIAELETSLGSEKARAGETLTRNESLLADLGAKSRELGELREEVSQLKSRNEETLRNNGRIQAELNRETAERTQIAAELEAVRSRSVLLSGEIQELKQSLSGKARELEEREQQYARSESETVQKLKRELGEALSARDAADDRSLKATTEKQALSSDLEKLKEQLEKAETAIREAKAIEEENTHAKGLLARRLEKAEASNSELAARVKEESMASIASRNLIEKLELQLRENESEAVRREQEQVVALQADIIGWKKKLTEEEQKKKAFEGELARAREAKREADERILTLNARVVELESETLSNRNLLNETEGKRGELSALLTEANSKSEMHAKDAEDLRRELADTISRFKTTEKDLLTKHGEEIDSLVAELRTERGLKEKLGAELSQTRAEMTETLRLTREESNTAQAKLIAEGNAKLSAVENELSEVIRSREIIEQSRNGLEDELNQRDEQMERLSERIEDLELKLQDEVAAREVVIAELNTTREGFSGSLHSTWKHLGIARSSLEKEKSHRESSENALAIANEEIAKLSAALEEQGLQFRTEIRSLEERYEALHEEKLTLASEDANLMKIREQLVETTAKKRSVEDELTELKSGVKTFQARYRELQTQKESLLKDREELKAELNAARTEHDRLVKRSNESKEQQTKLTETIAAAERRIQSLKKLESEMEQAVERKRQQSLLSRSDVFSSGFDALPAKGQFPQEDFYRKLISKLDLLDDLTKRYDNKWRYPKVAEQLAILKRSFVEFLNDHSVKQFDLEPGTPLSVAERKRIKLVPLKNGASKTPETNGNGSTPHNSHVVETLRPGYVYQDGSKDVIIRKAEVVVS